MVRHPHRACAGLLLGLVALLVVLTAPLAAPPGTGAVAATGAAAAAGWAMGLVVAGAIAGWGGWTVTRALREAQGEERAGMLLLVSMHAVALVALLGSVGC